MGKCYDGMPLSYEEWLDKHDRNIVISIPIFVFLQIGLVILIVKYSSFLYSIFLLVVMLVVLIVFMWWLNWMESREKEEKNGDGISV